MSKPTSSLDKLFHTPSGELRRMGEHELRSLLGRTELLGRWLRGTLRLKNDRQEIPAMTRQTVKSLMKDADYARYLPETIRIPAHGEAVPDVTKSLEEATVDDVALAQQAAEATQNALYKLSQALQELHRQARAKGALGADPIINALSGKGGAQ